VLHHRSPRRSLPQIGPLMHPLVVGSSFAADAVAQIHSIPPFLSVRQMRGHGLASSAPCAMSKREAFQKHRRYSRRAEQMQKISKH
jgi:hypothetical protein